MGAINNIDVEFIAIQRLGVLEGRPPGL